MSYLSIGIQSYIFQAAKAGTLKQDSEVIDS